MRTTVFTRCAAVFVFGLVATAAALAQSQTDKQRAEQDALRALRSRDLPEATLSSTTDEANWWKEVRAAAKAIGPAKASKKQRDDLLRLIKEGAEKSFQVPVGDRSATLADPFGHVWTVATHVEDVPPQELERRAKAQCGGS